MSSADDLAFLDFSVVSSFFLLIPHLLHLHLLFADLLLLTYLFPDLRIDHFYRIFLTFLFDVGGAPSKAANLLFLPHDVGVCQFDDAVFVHSDLVAAFWADASLSLIPLPKHQQTYYLTIF